jgi:type I restriction enzyme S subunit
MSFPTYAHYKDSGVEWLGEVPAHWDLKPLKHLVDFRSGGTPDKTNREFWDGEVPWASAKDLKTDELFDTIDHITETAVSAGAASLVEPGSILVVVRGMILARLFPVVTARVPMAINQDLKALSVKPHIHPDFMAWMLRGSEAETLRRLDEAGHGTKALRMDAWGAMRLPVPYLSEQVRIVDFLKVETTKLDALITEQRILIDLLKEKRQAVISHAVTKGLDPWVPMKDSGVEWLGEVPAHWTVCSLRRVIHSIEQGWSPECFSRQAEGDEWGVLKAGCVNRGIFNQDENKALPVELSPIPEYEVRTGDVLMSRASGSPELVGSTARVQAVQPRLMLSDKIFRIHLNSSVAPDYFVLALNSISLREQIEQALSGGNGMANNLPQSSLLEFMVCFPQVFEQEEIFRRVVEETTRLDALTAEAQTTIALLQERRSALISAAVTGKIDVRQHTAEAA